MVLLGIVIKWECKIVLRSALVVGYETVCTIPLYYGKEKGHEW